MATKKKRKSSKRAKKVVLSVCSGRGKRKRCARVRGKITAKKIRAAFKKVAPKGGLVHGRF